MRPRERLAALHPASSRRAPGSWLVAGGVTVDGAIVRRGDVPPSGGGRVELRAAPRRLPPPLRLVHEDDDPIVIDKPPGLLTVGTARERTAYRLLHGYVARGSPRRGARLSVVHRLERETPGLVVFAKSRPVQRALQDRFERRAVERVYVAVVEGRVGAPRGALRSRLRAQLAELGHPILADAACGSRHRDAGRLCLHATRLGFRHPRGHRVAFESAPPAVFPRVR